MGLSSWPDGEERPAVWNIAVLLVCCVIAAYHVSLLGRGALAWGDEAMSMTALRAARALANADLAELGRAVGAWGTRPGEVVVRLPAAALQMFVEKTLGLGEWSPASLRIQTAQNVAVGFLLSTIFYRLSLLFLGRLRMALAATVVFGLLSANHIWVRHVVPYDTALLCLLCALYLTLRLRVDPAPAVDSGRLILVVTTAGLPLVLYPVVFYRYRQAGLPLAILAFMAAIAALRLASRSMDRSQARRLIAAGAVSGLGLSLYPAWYSFHAGLVLLVLIGDDASRLVALSWPRVRAALLFALALLSVLLGFEVVSRLGNMSYLGGARLLSGAITQGSFEEGLVFLPKYLLQVEGAIGILLLILCLVSAVSSTRISNAPSPADLQLRRCCLVMALLYLFYGGVMGTVLHRMTFNGRYVRMYLPFVVWAAMAALGALKASWIRRGMTGLTLAASIVSFAGFAVDYARLDYPADVLHETGVGFEDVVPENVTYEADIHANYALPIKRTTEGADYITRPHDSRFVIVNFGTFGETPRHRGRYLPPPGATLLNERRHFQTVPASVFEGWGIDARRELVERAYSLRVYRLP